MSLITTLQNLFHWLNNILVWIYSTFSIPSISHIKLKPIASKLYTRQLFAFWGSLYNLCLGISSINTLLQPNTDPTVICYVCFVFAASSSPVDGGGISHCREGFFPSNRNCYHMHIVLHVIFCTSVSVLSLEWNQASTCSHQQPFQVSCHLPRMDGQEEDFEKLHDLTDSFSTNKGYCLSASSSSFSSLTSWAFCIISTFYANGIRF